MVYQGVYINRLSTKDGNTVKLLGYKFILLTGIGSNTFSRV